MCSQAICRELLFGIFLKTKIYSLSACYLSNVSPDFNKNQTEKMVFIAFEIWKKIYSIYNNKCVINKKENEQNKIKC